MMYLKHIRFFARVNINSDNPISNANLAMGSALPILYDFTCTRVSIKKHLRVDACEQIAFPFHSGCIVMRSLFLRVYNISKNTILNVVLYIIIIL